ncbi:addiction module antitoxin (plasmid) [Saccharobesus litoralis]|uniref:Addiction module antitoxin n=1 Tax=Saccharobesus litoralis TaxID=2172099 RepID=A0A2S0VYI2_9ALTE|nr:type II toxin-antitoxin system RelE/ParE family toxin [Saccharobesus litoralis]AWB69258.1 addiction module antitoxin [Saccharobesus litoralis]
MSTKVKLEYAPEFKRNVRQLAKKYRSIQKDLTPLLTTLEQGETPGDQIQGVGASMFKVRVKNSDSNKGKRGGYRVIYYVKQGTKTLLLSVYSKNDQADVATNELRQLVEKYKL